MQFRAASAPSSAAPRLQPSARLLRLWRLRPFAHLPSKPLPVASVSPVLLPRARRSLAFTPRAHSNHHGHGHHGHGQCHCHHGVNMHEGGWGAVVMRLAKAIGWKIVKDAYSFFLTVSAALDALVDIADGRIDIHVLMALAAFASVFMGNSLEGGLLLAMFSLAHTAEEYFTRKSMVDVRELKENHPEFALLLETSGDGSTRFSNLSHTKVPVHDLKVGSHILVRAGEAVPVDGEVYQGSSTVTIEHLTGETKPLERTVGDAIPGGARNLEGMMIVQVTKSWEDSTLNRIVELTEAGKINKPKLQRWLDEFGEHYSRAVVVLSLLVALLGPLLFKWPFFGNSVCRGSIYRALGLMVAASPCALAAAPLAYATAISSLTRKGILLKGGHVLDALSACQSIAFDKTGTLTTGKLMCKAIESIHGHLDVRNGLNDSSCCTPSCESEALAVAAAMEKGTTHPIGREASVAQFA
ncbi:hypothetical protein ZWY2020_038618 [Hordeum vulgare]|nr:hypothetical protein ZWY2020_038618 [Hordeum vulgare]